MSTEMQNNAPVSAEPLVARDLLRRAKTVLQLVDKDKGSTICTGGLISDISSYLAAPIAAQPDLTQQTLDDVKAGIPARDAEIAALRKEIETLRAAQAQQPVSGADRLPIELCGISEAIGDGGGFWRSCSGCHELNEGMATGPFSETFKCHLGAGCSECGGIGAIWDTTDYDAMADFMAAEYQQRAKNTEPVGQDQLRDAAQMIEPSGNSGELPELTIQWHDTPEAVHRIFWEKAALENGMTYEDLMEGVMVGETEHREKVDLTYEQEIQAIRDQKCWGCADTDTNQIHVWAAPDVDRTLLIHMLAHEIGHLTGAPHPDDIQEELRADTFGKVAAMAYQMLQAQQHADKAGSGQNYNDGFSDGVILALQLMTMHGDYNGTQYCELLTAAGPNQIVERAIREGMWEMSGLSQTPTAVERRAAIDAARKEQV